MGFLSNLVGAAAPIVGSFFGPVGTAIGGAVAGMATNSAQDARQEDAQYFNSSEASVNRIFNSEEASRNREFQASQASISRDYQERLSNSAYQRAMTDMRTAGLNPILAYAQGGASTPSAASAAGSQASGTAASSPTPATVRNVAAEALATAQQAAQIENTAAQTKATKEQANKTRIEADILDDQRRDEPIEVGLGDEPAKPVPRRHKYTSNEATRISTILDRERSNLTANQFHLVTAEIANADKEGRRIEATTGNIEADTVLKRLRQAEEKAGSDFWTSNPGFYETREYIKAGSEAVNSAAKALGSGLSLTPAGRGARTVQHLHRRVR